MIFSELKVRDSNPDYNVLMWTTPHYLCFRYGGLYDTVIVYCDMFVRERMGYLMTPEGVKCKAF